MTFPHEDSPERRRLIAICRETAGRLLERTTEVSDEADRLWLAITPLRLPEPKAGGGECQHGHTVRVAGDVTCMECGAILAVEVKP